MVSVTGNVFVSTLGSGLGSATFSAQDRLSCLGGADGVGTGCCFTFTSGLTGGLGLTTEAVVLTGVTEGTVMEGCFSSFGATCFSAGGTTVVATGGGSTAVAPGETKDLACAGADVIVFVNPLGADVCVGDITTGLWLLLGAGAAVLVGRLG